MHHPREPGQAIRPVSMNLNAVLERLSLLKEEIKAQASQFAQIIKQVKTAGGWNEPLRQRADTISEKMDGLHEELHRLVGEAETLLAAQGITIPSEQRPEYEKRWWKKDLTPEAVPPGPVNLDESLENGLSQLVARLPKEWWREQQDLRGKLGDDHLVQPLVLYGNMIPEKIPGNIHWFAYALMLSSDHLAKRDSFDVYRGARMVPLIGALCQSLQSLSGVKGGLAKSDELPHIPSEHVESRIHELLVAARNAEAGRDVEFLSAGTTKTPDLRVHDVVFPTVIECKRQSQLSSYEHSELNRVQEVFAILCKSRLSRGLIGSLEVIFRSEIREVPVSEVVEAALLCTGTLSLASHNELSWGSVGFSPLSPSYELPEETRIYGPAFMKHLFGWDGRTADYDGICAVVSNAKSVRLGRAELPFCLKWRVDADQALEGKARHVVRLLAEAVQQVPEGECGIIYIAYEDSHRAAVADKRTQRIMDLAGTFELRKPWVMVPKIVVGRLFPDALEEGRPDLIESSVPLLAEGWEDFGDFFPDLVYTYRGR